MGQLLGREAELELVERFLDAVPDARSALVIEGEPGIGKTAVWLEAVRGSQSREYRVLEARPAESESRLSYAALADLVGGVFEEVRGELPEPQQQALATAVLRAEAGERSDARTTATAIVSVLSALAARGSVVVAIDDVQWLDGASKRALEFAARRLPSGAALLLTRRGDGGEELAIGLERALPEDRIERLVPRPLSLAAVHQLVRERLGASFPRPLLARIATASGGNPFFALEIARALVRTTRGRALADPLPVPRDVGELLAARVRSLSPTAQEAVALAALSSRPTMATIVAALGHGRAGERALTEAEDAGVVFSDGGRVRFTHPLLASVVGGSVTSARRRLLHGRLAEVFTNSEERARHLAQAATRPDAEVASVVERAARGAAARGAHDAAAELFEAAGRLTPEGHADDRGRRLVGEVDALLAVGDVAAARPLAEAAVAASSAPPVLAEALLYLSRVELFEGASRRASEHVQQAFAVAAGDRDLEARVSEIAPSAWTLVDPEEALEHADARLRVLSAERQPHLFAHALIDRFWVGVLTGRGAARDLLQRGLELEARTPSELRHPVPLIWFHCVDEFDSARARYAVDDEWLRERGREAGRQDRLAHLALAELRAGRWDLAEQYVEASCLDLVEADARGPAGMHLAFRSLVDAHRGRTERARATLLPLIDTVERTERGYWTALALSVLAFAEFTDHDHEAVDRVLTRMYDRLDSIGLREMVMDRSEPFHVESLVTLGRLDRARDVLARLEERGRILPRPWIAIAAPRARALVLATEGDLGQALSLLDEVDIAAATRLPFELAWTLLVKGRLHRRAKERRAAADALQEALRLFEQLGAPTWVLQTRAELERIGLRRAPQALTPTELRVAELAAAGLTNREVAQAAFISAKTVEANLARVYRKLGIRSRAELGARMAAEARESAQQT